MKGKIHVFVLVILVTSVFALSGCTEDSGPSKSDGDVSIVYVDGEDPWGEHPIVHVTVDNTYDSAKSVTIRFQVKTSKDTYEEDQQVTIDGNSQEDFTHEVEVGFNEDARSYDAWIV